MTAGGKREGSGRKNALPEEKRVQLVITIDPETKRKIKAISEAKGIKVGRLIDLLVSSYEI